MAASSDQQLRAAAANNKVDIKCLIETWALDHFASKANRKEKRLLDKGNVNITLDWKRVKFTNDPPVYDPEPQRHGAPKTNVLFNTTFTNRTSKPQTYSFHAERTTNSSCAVEIEKAVTTGVEMNVKLTTPCQIFEANAGFKREMTLTNCECETIDEEMKWGVDTQVEVQGGHVGEAKLIVLEEKYEGTFTLLTRVSGVMHVVYTNLKDNNSFIKAADGNILEIVRSVMNAPTWQKTDVITIEPSTRSVIWVTKGKCQFKYGVKQIVEIDQKPIGDKSRSADQDDD